MTDLKVVQLSDRAGHFREPAHAVLRRIADRMEAGEFGEVAHGVLVLETDTQDTLFTFGPCTTEANAALALQAASARILDWYRQRRENAQ